MGFDPSEYLTSQGWSGPGTGFTPTARAKPITVVQKKNQFGIGKDRDTSYPWWDDVFSKIASKVGQPKSLTETDISHQTVTGLLSPLPLPASNQAQKGASSNLNLQVLQSAQKNASRQELYRRFLRGPTLTGSVVDDPSQSPPSSPQLINKHISQQASPTSQLDTKVEGMVNSARSSKKKLIKKKTRYCSQGLLQEPASLPASSHPTRGSPSTKSLELATECLDQTTSKPPKKKHKRKTSRANGTQDLPESIPVADPSSAQASSHSASLELASECLERTTDTDRSSKPLKKKRKRKPTSEPEIAGLLPASTPTDDPSSRSQIPDAQLNSDHTLNGQNSSTKDRASDPHLETGGLEFKLKKKHKHKSSKPSKKKRSNKEAVPS